MGMGRAGPSLGATSGAAPRALSAPSNNFAPNRTFATPNRSFAAPNGPTAFRDRDRGFRDRDHRRFRGFAFGGAPVFWGDYGYDYAYDNDYDYDDSCYALRRVYWGGYWHTRRVWICG
jgi:hypothetical protein